MPLDTIIIDTDQAVFQPAFGAATVVVRPGIMKGTGKTTLQGKFVCVDGDEKQLMVPGCMYTAGAFSAPGVGTLKIEALAGNQLTTKTKSGGKPVILKGATFTAKFEVQVPAMNPAPPSPVPDPMSMYMGQGQFVSTNVKFKAT